MAVPLFAVGGGANAKVGGRSRLGRSSTAKQAAYLPLNCLKPIGSQAWIVDGPVIRFGMPWPKMPFPTRMTVLRLRGDRLLVHSPTELTSSLRRELDELGEVAWLVAPSRLHYSWLQEWSDAFPHAASYVAPRVDELIGSELARTAIRLDRTTGYPWDDEAATLPVRGAYLTEVVLFHHPSRTLVLTDLIENFEAHKLGALMRWTTRLARIQAPDGQMPADMRFTFRKQREQLREAVEQMIAWGPERIVIAHGRWFERNGAEELRRAFRWVLQTRSASGADEQRA